MECGGPAIKHWNMASLTCGPRTAAFFALGPDGKRFLLFTTAPVSGPSVTHDRGRCSAGTTVPQIQVEFFVAFVVSVDNGQRPFLIRRHPGKRMT